MRWLVLALFVSSCGLTSFIPTGKGTNVAANTQVGKTNTQTLGTTTNSEQTIKVETVDGGIDQSNDTNKVNADSVDKVYIQDIPPWVLLLLILGWLLPTPTQIANETIRFFKWLLRR